MTDSMASAVGSLRTFLEAPESKSRHAWQDAGAAIDVQHSLSLSFRHSGWKRERRLVVEALRRTGQPESRLSCFAACGTYSYVLRSLDDPTLYRIAGSACHDRFCLPCAKDRSNSIALNVLDQIVGKQVRFLTLTLKATDAPLPDQLDRLYDAFQTLRRRAFWKRKVTGGVAFLECKWIARTGHWHPHFHILIQGKFMPFQNLKSLWYEITGDSYIIDIRLVRDSLQASRYVTKYASKPFNSSFITRPDQLDESVLALKGRKLVVTFGTWRSVLLTRPVATGAWEHVGTLDSIITRAANGDLSSAAILASLTDRDLSPLYARAPPYVVDPPPTPPSFHQLTWFGVWQRAGAYRYPQ
ncbi:hypothetical protein LCGC14_1481560 [marine sediment metagenome]|uniref:Replication protein n=1 Tax=marine sediment metagenome TaxID=412755 RepID=A0A0F9JVC4_9ZZZZ